MVALTDAAAFPDLDRYKLQYLNTTNQPICCKLVGVWTEVCALSNRSCSGGGLYLPTVYPFGTANFYALLPLSGRVMDFITSTKAAQAQQQMFKDHGFLPAHCSRVSVWSETIAVDEIFLTMLIILFIIPALLLFVSTHDF